MKNLTKKLFLSMLTVAFAVVALGTTTFAWFTLSTDAKVEQFNAQVTAGEGFEIRVLTKTGTEGSSNSSNWYSGSLPASAVEQVLLDTYEADWRLDAVTPDATVKTFTKMQLSAGTHSPVSCDGSKGEFIEFILEFRLVNKPEEQNTNKVNLVNFTLSETGAEPTTLDRTFNLKDGSVSYTADGNITYHASDAARIALFACNAGSEGDLITVLEKDDDSVQTNATEVHNSKGFCGQDWGAVKYYNLKNNIDGTDKAIKPDSAAPYASSVKDSTEVTETPILVGSLGSNDLQLKVKIWLEGWDAECINAIFRQVLTTSLTFKLADPEK